jgi:transposase
VNNERRSARLLFAKKPILEADMLVEADRSNAPSAVRTELTAIFISLELSQSKWLITSLAPGNGEKMSKFIVAARDVAGLLACLAELRRKAEARTGRHFGFVAIQEAGLDGFWLHRFLEAEGVDSYVVDPASIAVPRRARRVKTDRIDGEMLLRTLLAYMRGDPRVCAMVRAPTPEDEDRRRVSRERKALTNERIRHVNRIKGLLFGQGITGYEPLRRDRRKQLDELVTGDGRPLSVYLKAQIGRELDRIELLLEQIKVVEEIRDALLTAALPDAITTRSTPQHTREAMVSQPSIPAMLIGLKGIGPEIASVLWLEGLSRQFDNRRQVAAYAGLAASHWQSGNINNDQGVSKGGNPRLRTTLVQLAWLWVRHQPDSALSRWFITRVTERGPRSKKPTIIALARKLLVALWKYVTAGVLIEGVIMHSA